MVFSTDLKFFHELKNRLNLAYFLPLTKAKSVGEIY